MLNVRGTITANNISIVYESGLNCDGGVSYFVRLIRNGAIQKTIQYDTEEKATLEFNKMRTAFESKKVG